MFHGKKKKNFKAFFSRGTAKLIYKSFGISIGFFEGEYPGLMLSILDISPYAVSIINIKIIKLCFEFWYIKD